MSAQTDDASSIQPDERLDITGYVCPMTMVKVKLYLEDLESGRHLAVKIRLGESYNNVTRSLRDEGHRIVGERPAGEHMVELMVEKGRD